MRNNTNTQVIEGRIYQHNLQMRKVENEASENYGKDFINGTIDVATDDASAVSAIILGGSRGTKLSTNTFYIG